MQQERRRMGSSFWTRRHPQMEILEALEQNEGKISKDSLEKIFIEKSFDDNTLNESLQKLISDKMIYEKGSMYFLEESD